MEIKELEALIRYHEDGLSQYRQHMSPASKALEERTIKALKELKEDRMRYTVNRSASDPNAFQLVLTAENNDEDRDLRALYTGGSIIGLGETNKGRAELVIGTQPEIPR